MSVDSTTPSLNGTRRKWTLFVLFAMLMVGGIAFVRRARTDGAMAIDQQFATALYAGNASCAGCHAKETQEFHQTAHARALARADLEAVESFIDRDIEEANMPSGGAASVEYRWSQGRLWAIDSSSNGLVRVPIDWRFGSGEFGMTLVTLLEDRAGHSRLLEHHWSWFRDGDVLAVTPGHTPGVQPDGLELFGEISDSATTRQCFACHTTSFDYESGRIRSASVVPGVQCERCHGPRKEHVERMMRSRDRVPAARRPGAAARQKVYDCGECHRRPDEISEEIRPDNPLIARYPSVGLVQSRCFVATESQGTLTCVTCHDPHRVDPLVVSVSDHRCRDCHSPERDRQHLGCSIDPGDQSCTECHMPKVQLHEYLRFTDHWIRKPAQFRASAQ